MKQWEYYNDQIDVINTTYLNACGKEGWELIQIIPNGKGWAIFFKRELK